MLRLLCSEARVDSSKARAGYLGERDFPKLAVAAARLAEAPIFIDDSSDTSAIVLKAKCRRLARDSSANLGLIIVDYLQLMRAARPGESREKEIDAAEHAGKQGSPSPVAWKRVIGDSSINDGNSDSLLI